jgi:hypothetical protein
MSHPATLLATGDREEFGSHLDIEDLGSPGGCDVGPAFFLVFGRHRNDNHIIACALAGKADL